MPSNTLVTPEVIAKRVLQHVRNNCVLAKNSYRGYEKEWIGKKLGESINLRKPVKFTAEDGPTRVPQAISEETMPLTINFHKHVSWDWSVRQKTSSIEDYDERYMKPASIALVNALDTAVADLYKDVYMFTGTAGTAPNAYTSLSGASRKLDEAACPDDGKRICVLNPEAKWSMANVLVGLYDGGAIDRALREGELGSVAKLKVYGSQNIKTHTCGFHASDTVLVNGASQTGSSLIIDAATNATTIKHGDKFTIGSVNAVNPIHRASTGSAQCFTVTADATVTSGAATLAIDPKIVTTGAYQNVDAGPADNAELTEQTTTWEANLVYHPHAFAVAMIPPELPDSCNWKARASFDGFSLAITKAYDIDGFSEAVRIDMIGAIKCIQPEFACVLLG